MSASPLCDNKSFSSRAGFFSHCPGDYQLFDVGRRQLLSNLSSTFSTALISRVRRFFRQRHFGNLLERLVLKPQVNAIGHKIALFTVYHRTVGTFKNFIEILYRQRLK